MVNKYKVTTGFTIESREMTHVGGNHKRVRVGDQSLEVLLDSLQKVGVEVDRDNSQKNISYYFQGKQREQMVQLKVQYEKVKILGYELQTTEMQILVSEYDHSRGLGAPGVIGGSVSYITGIEVKLEYNGNTLEGVEEKCQKVEEVFKGLYDPMTRAWNEKLVAMTPKERTTFERDRKKLAKEFMTEIAKKQAVKS